MRFDEVELQSVEAIEAPSLPVDKQRRRFLRRFLALITDLSLFAALALALSPLLPQPHALVHLAALAGFVLMISYYYFVGTWTLWGKTIGGTIFDVQVASRDVRDASLRWAILVVSIAAIAAAIALTR